MTPRLLEELLAYRSTLGDVAHEAPAFPTGLATPRNKDNLNASAEAGAPACGRAPRRARAAGAAASGDCPHAAADVREPDADGWRGPALGSEPGRAQDAKMTLEVYSQVL